MIRPVGTSKQVAVDVRVISASNKVLEEEVEQGRFREDLFYRLNVIPVTLPPLQQRRQDIPLLVNHFVGKYADSLGKNVRSVSQEAMSMLDQFNWPGNVRQLENTIERAMALCNGPTIVPEDLPRNIVEYCPEFHEEVLSILPAKGVDLERKTEALEKSLIAQALVKTQYSQKKAAELLNVPVRSLRYRLKKYGMSPSGQRDEKEAEDELSP
jgi:DNA-binding NtrC family response regulator